MAFYTPRPDGLHDVTLDDGRTVPFALTAQQLEDNGIKPMPQSPLGGLPPEATASSSDVIDNSAAFRAMQAGARPDDIAPTKTDATQAAPIASPGEAPPDLQKFANSLGPQTVEPKRIDPSRLSGGPSALPPQGGAEPSGSSQGERNKEAATAYATALMRSGGGGTRKIAAHDELQAFSRQAGNALPDDVKNDFSGDQRPELMQASTGNILDQRQQLRDTRADQLRTETDALAQQYAHRQAIDAAIAKKAQVIDARDAEIEKVKPQSAAEVFKDRGAAAMAFSAVLVGLNAFIQNRVIRGTQVGTGNNMALETIQKSIQQQVQDQKDAYERAAERGHQARSDYADAIKLYGSPEAAELDMRMRYNGIYEKVIENQKDKLGDEQFKMAAEDQIQQLRQQRAQLKLTLNEYEKGRTLQESWRHDPTRVVGGGVDPLTAAKKGAEMHTALDSMYGIKADKEGKYLEVQKNMVRDPVSGERMWAPDPEAARESRKALNSAAIVEANNARMKEIIQSAGHSMSPTARAEYHALVAANTAHTKELLGIQRLAAYDMPMIHPLTGEGGEKVTGYDPATIASLDAANRNLTQVRQLLKMDLYRGPDVANAQPVGAPQGNPQYGEAK